MQKPDCLGCRFLKVYTSEDGKSKVKVCEGESPASGEIGGRYLITVVDTEEFDSSRCRLFRKA